MVAAEDDNVVQKLSSNAPHESLRRPVLPGASKRGPLGSEAEPFDRADHLGREDRVVVEDEEPMLGFVRERLSQLLNHPAAVGLSVTLK